MSEYIQLLRRVVVIRDTHVIYVHNTLNFVVYNYTVFRDQPDCIQLSKTLRSGITVTERLLMFLDFTMLTIGYSTITVSSYNTKVIERYLCTVHRIISSWMSTGWPCAGWNVYNQKRIAEMFYIALHKYNGRDPHGIPTTLLNCWIHTGVTPVSLANLCFK